MVDFEWNKSVKWSKLGIDGRTYPLLLVSIFIGWFLWVWVLLVLLFMYAGIKGVPLSMIFRKLKVKVSGKRMEAYPIHKQHGLKYGIALAVAMLTIHLPQESFAKFEVIDSLHYGVEWQQGDPGTTTSDIVDGFANDIPLELALSQIVPPTWVLLFTDDVNKNQMVSWRGGRPWAKVLKQIADINGVDFEIHTTTNRILVESANKGTVGDVTFRTGTNDSRKYTMEAKVWTLHKGQYLSQALRDWAQSIGWDVAWDLERDFIIEQQVTYKGSLVKAIKDLIKSYQNQRVMLRVQATEHYANHVIHIHLVNE